MGSLLRAVKTGLVVLLLIGIGLTVVGQLVGQPMIVFVETGSMAPTLESGDGYAAVPAMLAGEIEEGDVVLFDAEELGDGGGLTTHRVDAVTEDGYITKGDANPFTDQENEEPLVQDEQIRSVGFAPGGSLFVIPNLGGVVETVSGVFDTAQNWIFSAVGAEPPDTSVFAMGLIGVSLLLFLGSVLADTAGRARSSDQSRETGLHTGAVVIVVLLLVVLVPLNLTMLLPSGVYQYEVVSSNNLGDDDQTIEAGTTGEVEYTIPNNGHLPLVVVLEGSDDATHLDQNEYYVPRQSTASTSVAMDAPEETGTHYRYIEETRYLAVLPQSLIVALHSVHPVVAIIGVNAPIALAIAIVGITTLGTGRMRLRSRSRDLRWGHRLRRALPIGSFGADRPTKPSPPPLWETEQEGDRRPSEAATTAATAESDTTTRTPDSDERPSAFDDTSSNSDGRQSDVGDTVSNSGEGAFAFDDQSPNRYDWVAGVIDISPEDVGLEGAEWTPETLRTFLESAYDMQYTHTECTRLMGSFDRTPLRTSQIVDQSSDEGRGRSGPNERDRTDDSQS